MLVFEMFFFKQKTAYVVRISDLSSDVCSADLIGERSREAEELVRDVQTAGVLDNTVLMFGQMNEPPGSRFRVGHAALTVSEYFRDDARQDVLLLIDNVFRFIQAGSEVSGLLGRLPSRMGYQPTLGTELAELER